MDPKDWTSQPYYLRVRKVSLEKRCTALNVNGQRCGRPKKKGTSFCGVHQRLSAKRSPDQR